MDKHIRLRVSKDLDNKQHKGLLELKGTLVRKGYTDIIHIHDDGEEFHINSFVPNGISKDDVAKIINDFCASRALTDCITLL